MNHTEKLQNLAKEILKANLNCMLSGSLALKLQGIKTRREPQDLDIYLPYGQALNAIPGMSYIPPAGEYPPDNWDRKDYVKDNITINIFTPENANVARLNEGESWVDIKMVCAYDIIKFKVQHAFADHWTRFKHKDDIMWMLIENTKI